MSADATIREGAFLEVIAPGALSHVQDLGRHGWRHLGVARGGALDPDSAALANVLVGNRDDAAVLELSLQGPTLRLSHPSRIAVIGAECAARFEGDALPMARPIDLPAGTLSLGGMRDGVRCWLALRGGIDTPRVLGSRATDLRGGFGGIDGRGLRAGDRLPIGAHIAIESTVPRIPGWWIDPRFDEAPDAPIRYLAHPSAPLREASARLAAQLWRVSASSNRQGLRLDGAALAAPAASGVSEPVAPGTIQLPADGQPIVLLADAQTVGGYARLGHVIAADLPRLAQAGPRTALRFRACDAAEAAAALRESRARLARLKLAIDARSAG